MDRAYQGNATRALVAAYGMTPVVPPLKTRRDPWPYDQTLYRRRNEVERFFRRLKRFRRVSTRYDKLDALFLGFIHLAMSMDLIKISVNRP